MNNQNENQACRTSKSSAAILGPIARKTAGCALMSLCLQLVAGQASAQTNVQIYGVVDNAIQSTFGQGTLGQTKTEVTSGYFAASRLGFKGSEDLGDGMKAFFQLEMGLATNTGALQQGGRLFGRTAQVGISSSLGSLALGRLGTPGSGTGPYNMTNGPKPIDPFYLGYGAAGWANSSNTMALPLRADNSLVYRTPQLGGLTFAGLYSFQRDGTEAVGASTNARVTGLGLSYDHGPLFAMISYDHTDNPLPGQPAQTALQVGAVYDFNIVKLHMMAGQEKNEFLFSTAVESALASRANFAAIGLTVPLSSGRIMLGLQARKASQIQGGSYGRRIASVGYTYDLSKRTALNMAFSDSRANQALASNPSFNFRQVGCGVSHFF
ncbi:porin [Glaciimonas soli]|uniref:Porin n=1 Tax=Glaciimonas soli TaxID=2590999 RepID=A0A843YWJ4_9BURK|nr:porin [Glaciimonas soli]MQR02063.1 porin [Glaciimonas soli]